VSRKLHFGNPPLRPWTLVWSESTDLSGRRSWIPIPARKTVTVTNIDPVHELVPFFWPESWIPMNITTQTPLIIQSSTDYIVFVLLETQTSFANCVFIGNVGSLTNRETQQSEIPNGIVFSRCVFDSSESSSTGYAIVVSTERIEL
jgi:hypothetical protein